mgnify:CR=1 FL=1
MWYNLENGQRGDFFMEVLKFADKTFFRKESKIQTLPIDKIRPNPYQTRKYFNFNALEELAASIKKCGLLQPITVRKLGSVYYELITGERRLRACEIAGYTTISALVLHINDSQSALLSMIENLQRQDLNFLEEAEGYQNMMQDYHMTLEELANNLSKSQSSIANKIRLLKLSDSVRKKMIQYQLTEQHGRAILKIPEEEIQLELLDHIAQKELTVKQTEELVAEIMEQMCQPKQKHIQKEKRYIKDIRLFTNSIRQSINIIKKSGMHVSYENNPKEDGFEIVIRVKK